MGIEEGFISGLKKGTECLITKSTKAMSGRLNP
jgi:hypothetical protein